MAHRPSRLRFDARLLLRIGAAFAFLYPPVAALIDPVSWISYIPPTVRELVNPLVFLHTFGAIEVILALWVLSGWRIRIPAFLMTAILVVVAATNWSELPVLFRDLSLAMMTLALAVLPEPTSPSAQPRLPHGNQGGQS